MGVDWSHRADYMAARHGVTVEQANEALADPDALVFDPDYASRSGRSVRTIGWSTSADRLLTVITGTEGDVTYGVNGWPANDIDTRHYRGPDRDASRDHSDRDDNRDDNPNRIEEMTMTGSDAELRRLLDEEAEHAEATKDDPIPTGALARATRPNHGKSVMFSLRLHPNELAAVQALAADQGVPASTLVRGWIVRRLADEHAAGAAGDAAAMLERLETDVRVLRKLIAS